MGIRAARANRPPSAPRALIRSARKRRVGGRETWWRKLDPGITALLGVAIGFFGSVYLTERQIDAQAELSSSEYLREQRTAAYEDLLSEEDRLVDLERRIDAGTNRGGSSLVEWVNQHQRRLKAQENALDDAVARVEMFGSPDAVAAAKRLVAGHTPLLETIYGALRLLPEQSPRPGYDPSFGLIDEPTRWRQPFVDVVRDDLGIGG